MASTIPIYCVNQSGRNQKENCKNFIFDIIQSSFIKSENDPTGKRHGFNS